ncbi:unnamed protein product [Lactuca virosa]|uniref:Retrotransposon Copia-like N-terminal domain-containing protein n=1 Tax=Lactuca virosa TaxID=75947 RepID=A0AAU9M9L3_9ASTR|nr:unnamed protein product [Lactuca virosa]
MDNQTTTVSLLFSTMIHMIIIQLNPNNYLLWKNHIYLIPKGQNLFGYLDGSIKPPSTLVTNDQGEMVSNPKYLELYQQDQIILSLLNYSLTEEAMAEVLECQITKETWLAYEYAYGDDSPSRELATRDLLEKLSKGQNLVCEYGKQF